jgi:hypothetical protein
MKKFHLLPSLGIAVLAALILGLALRTFSPSFAPVAETPVFPHATLAIRRADGTQVSLDIEIAVTRAQAEYGLMFRRFLPENAGMLFLWDKDQAISMWMKNTIIPLDMLFVAGNGTIVKIAHAIPFDLTPISSGQWVRGVIEINGGAAARQGIEVGDKVLYPAFSSP